MFSKVHSVAVLGLECAPITVEVDIAGSWPSYQIVGLPDAAIQEAKERIRTAWKNTGLSFPSNSRVIINLAPADVRKEGASYDLPMAVGMYLATQSMPQNHAGDALFVGELALDGTLRHTSGILPLTLYAKEAGYKRIFLPATNAKEAQIIGGIDIFPVPSLSAMLAHLTGTEKISAIIPQAIPTASIGVSYDIDMAHIKGQEYVKRALEIAASGAHNILLSGPPGSGKTLLARALPSILPPMTSSEVIEATKIYSVAGLLTEHRPLVTDRPFRAPHHSASAIALVGGGKFPRPGEISLAHRGILFLDEFPEFPRHVLEMLRQPLEDGIVTVSRAQGTLTFPAHFTLVASQNPCPCGYLNDPDRACICGPGQILKYQKKISGPLFDRIDLSIHVPRVAFDKLATEDTSEPSATIRERVAAARERQSHRFHGSACVANSDMRVKEIKEFCKLSDASLALLKQAMLSMHLSARSFHRIIKLARTIADLAAAEKIETAHVAEAIQYRPTVDR